jgi:mannan endo-1,4-beta-mannosidase
MVGAYEAGVPNWSGQAEFAAATGIAPRIVLYYSAWNQGFSARFAQEARRHGAYVLVQLQPAGVSLASIVAGHSDRYLRSYALQVRTFGYPVILSFGHEMNGAWYSWGAGHEPPSVFVAAWRHVVQVFRDAGATNVTWMWTVNATDAPLRPWWPGAAWVNWVGLDGYYYWASDSFTSVFAGTIAQIREFSRAPVLIAETGVGVTTDRQAQISALFAGAAADHVIGVVWFDADQHAGIYHQDWRLEDDPAALAAFSAAAHRYAKS